MALSNLVDGSHTWRLQVHTFTVSVTFQVFDSHMWLMATAQSSTNEMTLAGNTGEWQATTKLPTQARNNRITTKQT